METPRPSIKAEVGSHAREIVILVPYIMAVALVTNAALNALGVHLGEPVIVGASTTVGAGIRQVTRR